MSVLRDGLSVEAAAHVFGANAIRLQQDQEALGGKKKSQGPNEKFRAITKNVGRATRPNRDCARVRQAKGQVGTGKTLMAWVVPPSGEQAACRRAGAKREMTMTSGFRSRRCLSAQRKMGKEGER